MKFALKVLNVVGSMAMKCCCVIAACTEESGSTSEWQPFSGESLMHSVAIHPYQIFNGWFGMQQCV